MSDDFFSRAAANGLDPARMSADERLAEVAEILAAGLLRLRGRRLAESGNRRESSLDFPAGQSVHGPRGRVGGRR